MNILNHFKLNRSKLDSMEVSKDLNIFVENFVSQKEISIKLKSISDILDVDLNVLQLKTKRILLSKFDYEENKFKNLSNYLEIFKECAIFFYIFLKLIFSFKKANAKIKKTGIILSDIVSIDEIDKFKHILKRFEHSTIISNYWECDFKKIKKNILPKEKTDIQDKYLVENLIVNYKDSKLNLSYKDKNEKVSLNTDIICRKDLFFEKESIKDKFKLLKCSFLLMHYSFKEKFNFLFFFNRIVFSYIINFSIFKNYKSKILLQDRIYNTCAIRNSLFKKMGGEVAACVQSHIAEGSINMFGDTDLLFTFGQEKDTVKDMVEFGSKIRKSVPVGSLRYEGYCINAGEGFFSKEKVDILILGVNLTSWFFITEKQQACYYDFLKLMRLISIKHKNLNIYIKHHPNNFDDSIERDILKDSNVKYIDKLSNSYRYFKNTKLFFSFSSSMIAEVYGAEKIGYFINPSDNDVFFKTNRAYKKIVLNNYKQVDEIIQKYIVENKAVENNFSDICLKSDKVSELIFHNLITQKI